MKKADFETPEMMEWRMEYKRLNGVLFWRVLAVLSGVVCIAVAAGLLLKGDTTPDEATNAVLNIFAAAFAFLVGFPLQRTGYCHERTIAERKASLKRMYCMRYKAFFEDRYSNLHR